MKTEFNFLVNESELNYLSNVLFIARICKEKDLSFIW